MSFSEACVEQAKEYRPDWVEVLYEYAASFGIDLPQVDDIAPVPYESDPHIARVLTLLQLLSSNALADLYRSQVLYDHTRYEVGSYPVKTTIELLRRLMKFGSIRVCENDTVGST